MSKAAQFVVAIGDCATWGGIPATAPNPSAIHLVRDGERVFVTYEARGAGGHRFRNTEIVTVRGKQIVEVEVYFGWNRRTRHRSAAS